MRAKSRTRRGTTAGATMATALAMAMALALAGCGSSGSTKQPAPTEGTASTQQFCHDLQQTSTQVMPPVGSPMGADELDLFDRLLDEAPAAVKGTAKTAHDAAHAQAGKMTAEGMKHITDAVKKLDAWASDPKNCPAFSSD